MKQLIEITERKGMQMVDARTLHKRLGTGRDFSNWIKGRIREYGFKLNEDYLIDNQRYAKTGESNVFVNHNFTNSGGDRRSVDYLLSLDMAKELCLIENNPVGRQFRRYFIDAEKQVRLLMPPAIVSETGERCLPYVHWLLANGFSVRSGQVGKRIRKYPHLFRKSHGGAWYVSEKYALLLLKQCEAPFAAAELPAVNLRQLEINGFFDKITPA